MNPSIVALVLASTLLLAAGTLFAAPAHAAPGAHASCVGIESSAISPPGSSDEELGGRPQLATELRQLAAGLGVTPGALVSGFAHLHAGSHEACDAPAGG